MKDKSECFYVFYDKSDNIICAGTARQLVADGYFHKTKAAAEKASKIKSGKLRGHVVILND